MEIEDTHPETSQVFRQRSQVKIVDDYQVAAGRADHQSVLVRHEPASHQSGRVEHLLVHKPMLGVAVDVPGENGSVEAGRHQEAVFFRILNVLHPVRVSVQAADFRFEIPGVPQCHRCVVRAGGEHAIVEKPESKQMCDEVRDKEIKNGWLSAVMDQ